LRLERLRVHRRGLQHARELQQLGELDLHAREAVREPRRHRGELLHPRLVDLQATLLLRRAQAQRQVELAALDPGSDPFPQGGFERAQVVVHAHSGFKEAMVDRAQLATERAPPGIAFAAGEGGHAADHAQFQSGQGPNGKLAGPLSGNGGMAAVLPAGFTRPSGRAPDELRPVTIERHFTRHAEGSVLVSFGDTRVLCTASVENRVGPWLRGKGEGWVTAEYGMLPRATHTRSGREAARGKQGGRARAIQRLIGRSLRACVDRKALGERTITLDCDVIQADGGTRTAAITGAYVALVDAIELLVRRG